MKKTELEKLVFEIMEELKYLRNENTNLVRTQRENYLEVIEKWEESIDRFHKLNVKGED